MSGVIQIIGLNDKSRAIALARLFFVSGEGEINFPYLPRFTSGKTIAQRTFD
jgi:hypothetical protein